MGGVRWCAPTRPQSDPTRPQRDHLTTIRSHFGSSFCGSSALGFVAGLCQDAHHQRQSFSLQIFAKTLTFLLFDIAICCFACAAVSQCVLLADRPRITVKNTFIDVDPVSRHACSAGPFRGRLARSIVIEAFLDVVAYNVFPSFSALARDLRPCGVTLRLFWGHF